MNMKDQNVVGIKRFKRKIYQKEEDTGLYMLTFSTTTKPKEVKVGYFVYEVRHYVPPPLRCFNCLRFNHLTEKCKKNKVCVRCGEDFHLASESERCEKEENCVNCSGKHTALSKICPKFKRQKEIKMICVKENVEIKKAVALYDARNPSKGSYSQVVSPPEKKCNCKCSCSQENGEKTTENVTIPENDEEMNEKIPEILTPTYINSDISKLAATNLPSSDPSTSSSTPNSLKDIKTTFKSKEIGKNKIILPKTLNKRQKYQLKQYQNKKNLIKKLKPDSNVESTYLSNEYITDEESQSIENHNGF
jgi:hypothetical protein